MNALYTSPRFDQENDDAIYGGSAPRAATRVPVRRRAPIISGGNTGTAPGMVDPYGGAFNSYAGPSGNAPMLSGGPSYSNSAPTMSGNANPAPAPMDLETYYRLRNQGNVARGPSPGSTVGRIKALAEDPVAGAVASRMPNNAPYADILNSRMAPILQSNQMGEIGVDYARKTAPNMIARQGLENDSLAINNDAERSLVPGLVPQQQAGTRLTNARAGDYESHGRVNDAQANYLPTQQRDLHSEMTAATARIKDLESKIARYEAMQAHGDAAAQHQQQATATAQGVQKRADTKLQNDQRQFDTGRLDKAAGQVFDAEVRKGNKKATLAGAREQATDTLGLRGSPTTQPATQQPQAAPATQPAGGDTKVYQGFQYQLGADGQYHKVGPAQ